MSFRTQVRPFVLSGLKADLPSPVGFEEGTEYNTTDPLPPGVFGRTFHTVIVGGVMEWRESTLGGGPIVAGPSDVDYVVGDVTTNSGFPDYVSLLRVGFDGLALKASINAPVDGFVLIDFVTTARNAAPSGASIFFRLVLDGVPIPNSDRATSSFSLPESLAVTERVAVLAGVHAITVEWCVSPSIVGADAAINRTSNPGEDGATLRVFFMTS